MVRTSSSSKAMPSAFPFLPYREEKEKLNVWVGWMNLENLYGSQESLIKVFESALRENEPLEVFTRLVAIYQQSQKFDVSMHGGACKHALH